MLHSRRHFLRTTGSSLAALPFLGLPVQAMYTEALTIQQAIDYIIDQVGLQLPTQTVDTVKSGDPTALVTGIATTCMATIPVIRRAIEDNINLIVTHEPTFYNHLDETVWLAEDPVYRYKRQLLEEHGIVVWRFHDLWHKYRPDGIMTGFYRQLGWTEFQQPGERNIVSLPLRPLRDLAKYLQTSLTLDRIFIIGDPKLPCSNIGCLPGAWGRQLHIDYLQQPIEALIIGEGPEWETAEYVRDAAAAGLPKALIILGHIGSEEPGMVYCQEWIKRIFPSIHCIHLEAGDSFQNIV